MKQTKKVPDPVPGPDTIEIKNLENKNMKKSKVIFFGIIIIIIIAIAVWAGVWIAGMSGATNPNALSPYSAVYLSTGDIYFGKLSWFPSPHMTDAWLIERSQGQNGQVQTALVPMKSVVWGPSDEIDFNSQDIVFSTRLVNNSQVVQAIENPSSLQQQPTGAQTGAPGMGSSTMPITPTTPTPSPSTNTR